VSKFELSAISETSDIPCQICNVGRIHIQKLTTINSGDVGVILDYKRTGTSLLHFFRFWSLFCVKCFQVAETANWREKLRKVPCLPSTSVLTFDSRAEIVRRSASTCQNLYLALPICLLFDIGLQPKVTAELDKMSPSLRWWSPIPTIHRQLSV